MTTIVRIENQNDGTHATWDVEVLVDGVIVHTLKPGEAAQQTLWHDGRSIEVREKP